MNIGSVNVRELLTQYSVANINRGSESTADTGAINGSMRKDRMEISPLGQLLSQIRTDLGEGENNEIKDFFDKVFESIRSGDFDAAALAEEAPEALKTYAEENGIDLEELLNTLNTEMSAKDKAFAAPKMPPPPPPMDPIISGIRSELGKGENNEIKDFFDKVFESIRSGDFDAAALAEETPEALKTYAEEHGFDLSDLLNMLNAEATLREKIFGGGMAVNRMSDTE